MSQEVGHLLDAMIVHEAWSIIEPGAVNLHAIVTTLSNITGSLKASGMWEEQLRAHPAVVVICSQIDELVHASDYSTFEEAYDKIKSEIQRLLKEQQCHTEE